MKRLLGQSAVARVRLALGALAIAGLSVVAFSRPSFASDHEDEPSLLADPGADIADVYAFVRPEATTHLVLVMTLHPGATRATTFDPAVEYQFRVLGYANGAYDSTVDTRITCRFQPAVTGTQDYVCAANGTSVIGTVGTATTADAGTSFRAWAGLRADPAFGDVAAMKATLANRTLAFTAPGTNAFAGKNVLAIVLEVAIDSVLLEGIDVSGGRPKLAVSATTERL